MSIQFIDCAEHLCVIGAAQSSRIVLPFIYQRRLVTDPSSPVNPGLITLWNQWFPAAVTNADIQWRFLNGNRSKPKAQTVEGYTALPFNSEIGYYRSVMSNKDDLCREFGLKLQGLTLDRIRICCAIHQRGRFCWPIYTGPAA